VAIEQKLSLMIPGPTPVPEKVLQALGKHPIGHRSKEFQDLVERLPEISNGFIKLKMMF